MGWPEGEMLTATAELGDPIPRRTLDASSPPCVSSDSAPETDSAGIRLIGPHSASATRSI